MSPTCWTESRSEERWVQTLRAALCVPEAAEGVVEDEEEEAAGGRADAGGIRDHGKVIVHNSGDSTVCRSPGPCRVPQASIQLQGT